MEQKIKHKCDLCGSDEFVHTGVMDGKAYESAYKCCTCGVADLLDKEEKKQMLDDFYQEQSQKHQQNVPKCPICNSTKLSKITTTKKVAKIAMFGIFGMGDNGKTWKCNSCGSKF